MYKSILLSALLSAPLIASAQCGKGCCKKKVDMPTLMHKVDSMAHRVVATGFNAGDGYGEVWIRDYNTFIELSMDVMSDEAIRTNLNTFFHFQGPEGDIVDGFLPIEKAQLNVPGGYDYRHSATDKKHVANKNTVETDHETSLVQAVYRYVTKSGNKSYLKEKVAGKSVLDRLEWSLDWLYEHKYNSQYGLIIGATTADWGDVQPEHPWGVVIDEDSHMAIDIYDNAMLIIAINNFIELADDKKMTAKWAPKAQELKDNIRKHLWDAKNQKFIPHIYLDGSPFPDTFDENEIYYHGGTAVAIQAGVLTPQEVRVSYEKMVENVKKAHAQTIGLTMYPTYPAGYYENKGMYPYGYQNGGDWTWFGARMINGMLKYDMAKEAARELRPMLERIIDNNGFYEWYTPAGEPMGSGTFRGEAGVLYSAINELKAWEERNK